MLIISCSLNNMTDSRRFISLPHLGVCAQMSVNITIKCQTNTVCTFINQVRKTTALTPNCDGLNVFSLKCAGDRISLGGLCPYRPPRLLRPCLQLGSMHWLLKHQVSHAMKGNWDYQHSMFASSSSVITNLALQ